VAATATISLWRPRGTCRIPPASGTGWPQTSRFGPCQTTKNRGALERTRTSQAWAKSLIRRDSVRVQLGVG